jgi:hypothetical protein
VLLNIQGKCAQLRAKTVDISGHLPPNSNLTHNPALKKVSSKIKKFSPRSNVPPINLARNCVNVARRCVSCKKSKIGEVLVKPACYTSEEGLLDGLSDQMTRATSLMRKREAPER